MVCCSQANTPTNNQTIRPRVVQRGPQTSMVDHEVVTIHQGQDKATCLLDHSELPQAIARQKNYQGEAPAYLQFNAMFHHILLVIQYSRLIALAQM